MSKAHFVERKAARIATNKQKVEEKTQKYTQRAITRWQNQPIQYRYTAYSKENIIIAKNVKKRLYARDWIFCFLFCCTYARIYRSELQCINWLFSPSPSLSGLIVQHIAFYSFMVILFFMLSCLFCYGRNVDFTAAVW